MTVTEAGKIISLGINTYDCNRGWKKVQLGINIYDCNRGWKKVLSWY